MTVAPRIPDAGTAHSAMPVWPPTGTQTARKPAGGFINCHVDYLTLPWWVYQALNQHLCHQGQSSAVTVREDNHDQ